jgi:hypothetical protein
LTPTFVEMVIPRPEACLQVQRASQILSWSTEFVIMTEPTKRSYGHCSDAPPIAGDIAHERRSAAVSSLRMSRLPE